MSDWSRLEALSSSQKPPSLEHDPARAECLILQLVQAYVGLHQTHSGQMVLADHLLRYFRSLVPRVSPPIQAATLFALQLSVAEISILLAEISIIWRKSAYTTCGNQHITGGNQHIVSEISTFWWTVIASASAWSMAFRIAIIWTIEMLIDSLSTRKATRPGAVEVSRGFLSWLIRLHLVEVNGNACILLFPLIKQRVEIWKCANLLNNIFPPWKFPNWRSQLSTYVPMPGFDRWKFRDALQCVNLLLIKF